MGAEVKVFDSPFAKFVMFGDGVSQEQIRVLRTETKPEDQDRENPLEDKRNELIEETRDRINKKAAERGVEPRQVFDGFHARLDSLDYKSGKVIMQVGETSHFRHLAYDSAKAESVVGPVINPSCQHESNSSWHEETPEHQAMPIGAVLGLVIEEGKYIMVGTPKEQTNEAPLLKATPSGYSDQNDLDENNRYDPFRTPIREMMEETGIGPNEITSLKLRGRSFDRRWGEKAADLVFTAEANQLTRSEILNKDKEEDTDQPLFIPYTREGIRRALLGYTLTSQGYMQGLLISLAHDKFGDEEANYLEIRLRKRGELYFAYMSPNQSDRIRKKQEKQLTKKAASH